VNIYSSYTDSELLVLLSQDDKDAFDSLYSKHWADLYKSAYFILKDPDACKDIVQDIFVWLWEHRKGLEVHALKSYLRAAVKFKVANYIRSGNIRESFFDELIRFTPSALSPTVADFSEIKELNAIIQQAISHLPAKCREIFKLSREEHLSNQEIANRLSISVKTVENQMTIALRRIRNTIEPYMINLLIISIVFYT
jgi:RNA polymerase sigma-70 factor (ECF subfamily)